MQLLTVLIFVLIVKTCLARSIIETSKRDELFGLIPATVEVLTSCYRDQLNAVGLAGNSDGFFIKTLQSSTSVPVTLVDGTKRSIDHAPVQRINRYKLQFFVVTTSSSTELQKTLTVMKNSLWWNHMASILILAWLPISEDGCSKAFEMLSTAWKMDLINTKMICLNPEKEIWIYTYNPFIAKAPDCWKEENTYIGENGHPWTLFKQRYEEDRGICKELDFDKTLDLGGYPIRSTLKDYPGSISLVADQSARNRFNGPVGDVCNIMFLAMNATTKLLLYNRTKSVSFVDENGRDVVMDTVEGRSDILLNQRYATVRKDISATYPHMQVGLGILTQGSKAISELDKISSVVDQRSRRGICLVILITPLFFIFVMRQSPLPALLDTLRLICNSSLLRIPTNLAPRFYLGCLFVFVVTVQAIYQGKLAAMLTKPIFLPNVETAQDLVDRQYTVYAYKSLQRFFSPSIFEGRYVQLEKFSCVEYVVEDPLAACMLPYEWLITIAVKYRLYLSKHDVFLSPLSFVIRDDWPLESRVNEIVTSMFETRIFSYEYLRPVQRLLDVHDILEKHKEDEQYQSIAFNELSFAFIILAIGLSCATVCFIVEIGFQRVKVIIAVSLRKI